MMIIDLTHCDIIHDMDQDPDTIPDNAGEMVIHHLKKMGGSISSLRI